MIRKPSIWALSVLTLSLAACGPGQAPATGTPAAKSALAVSPVSPQKVHWAEVVAATGNVQPWQETSVGTEVGGLRLSRVLVNVGDKVKKGQVLARLDSATVQADRDTGEANVAEAEANLQLALRNADRAQRLSPSGALSAQEILGYQTQKRTAEAKLKAARAQLTALDLRLSYTTLVAPDDGVISARTATEGTVIQAGSELFRLIRQGRLEWRAEVKGETLLRLKTGQAVTVKHPLGGSLEANVRQVSPSVDVATRNGIAYVDLPATANVKSGMYLSGSFTLGARDALAVPQEAVVVRDGYTLALTVDKSSKVQAVKITPGQSRDGMVEVLDGLTEKDVVVVQGAGFLKAGDVVTLVPALK